MPYRELLEEYPLYRKYPMELPKLFGLLEKPAIHMYCFVCESEQTFNSNHGWPSKSIKPDGRTELSGYTCTSCKKFNRYFLVKFDPEGHYVMKVGQEPPWDISIDRTVEKALGTYAKLYKKGLISESQGYGIGAFSYYRRIVHEIIDTLLNDIAELMSGADLEEYKQALEQAKQTRVTQEKIDLVKDHLPAILRPGGGNPLKTLHSILSEGLHAESDEQCLRWAEGVRNVLEFLLSEVTARKQAASTYEKSMEDIHKSLAERDPDETASGSAPATD